MSITKKIARNFILPISIKFHLDQFFLKRAKKKYCIINFHGVRENNSISFNNRHIPVTEFEKIIIYLKKNYVIASLADIFEIHRSNERKANAKKTVALTFDDGYSNNFDIALPILKKHNVPATFYLISKGIIDKDFFVWPDIIDIIKKYHKEDITIDEYIFKYPSFYNEHLKMDLLNYLKTCGDKTEKKVKELSLQFNYHSDIIQKFPELIQLIREKEFSKFKNEPLVEYGSHTHTHYNLEFLNKDMAETELVESKEIIEKNIEKNIISLAFPDGSYTKETLDIALKAGYKNLVAVEYKFDENNSNPNLLSRFTISNSTTFESNVLRLAKDFDKYGF